MRATEIIEPIKGLPPGEGTQMAKLVVKRDDSWIPDECKEAMRDAEAGRIVDRETARFEILPPPWKTSAHRNPPF